MIRGFLAGWVVVLLSGCSSISYYSQLADGQWQLLRAREPVAEVIADPTRPQPLRDHLVQAQKARMFASEHLHLPDNQSYRLYADIGRPYVVWNVFATQEFSLSPENHCFPIAGCVAYRGYYSQGAARGEAALLRQRGMDVSIGGVEAYSTLGWFNDPIMSSMMHWGDERLATLIFHELAHQRFYVKDDTEFNESFATFVEQEGTRQWRVARGLAPLGDSMLRQRDQFTRLILDTRKRLETLYAQPLSAEAMRQAKAAQFERLRQDYRQLRDSQWAGDKRYDAWINQPMNNARLLPFGLYDQWVPAFAALFKQEGGDWVRFYAAVERMGQLPVGARKTALRQLESVAP
ncbi:aminopeptidase [Pseudomonas extremaustralis]|jgi:predicted aminopeptidase|uniref:Aminopeptidase n=1 Tax=Pseudomonas extremaustralis TaxID=359110 RepID=A0A5C5QD97_9PSED|nr:aminopeptidase [Pseudomonas extremaustralis]EZI25898.1 aminopeptidase [Pseudomonas extremaustralis 14-3 substr. 14-3b]MDB1109020.1 aminopeptidase [Pseudomonas extremaustralis]MDF3133433.1 aminopeptidase [Pseudomonas extremaustralis]MDG2968849.1 aminopeptidase [Pseudomonas extremaustralis]TWS03296.1 aminopeptidase [Pseudomonas extremaustralis]